MKPQTINLIDDNEFRAWLAGLIDGDGSFYVDTEKSRCRVCVVLEERDKFVLEYIKNKIGGSLYYRKPLKSWKPNWKPQWEWKIASIIDCIKFTEWLEPFLILKKETSRDFMTKILRN